MANTTGLNPEQFLDYIIRPSLKIIGSPFNTLNAEKLLMGTAAHESCGFIYIHQAPGPAVSIYQIEPNTANLVFKRVINESNALSERYENLYQNINSILIHGIDLVEQLHGNLYLATIIARLVFWFDPKPLPTDPRDMAEYYKRVYNTEKGKATSAQWLAAYRKIEYVFGIN
jgi:hypothetical protein